MIYGRGGDAAAGKTAGGPGFRLPRRDRAILLARDLDLGVGRRTVARDHLFGGAVEEQLHRTAAGLLRKAGAHLAPGIRREFAAESAADVVLLDVDIGDRHFEVRRQRAGIVRDILRGGPHVDLVALPLDDLPMRLQAAVGNDWDAVLPLGDRFGLLESLVRIAHQFLAGRFGARPGLAQVVFLDQVRQHFILHLDLAHGVAGDLFGGGRHGRNFRALPLDLGPRGGTTCTAFTPAVFSAALVSMLVTRAWACGLLRYTPKSMSLGLRSEEYLARPLAFCGPSRRL